MPIMKVIHSFSDGVQAVTDLTTMHVYGELCSTKYSAVMRNSPQIDIDGGPDPIDVPSDDEDEDSEPVKIEEEPSTSTEASAQAASEFKSRLTSNTAKKTRCESNLLSLIKSGIIKIEPASERPPKAKVECGIHKVPLHGSDLPFHINSNS